MMTVARRSWFRRAASFATAAGSMTGRRRRSRTSTRSRCAGRPTTCWSFACRRTACRGSRQQVGTIPDHRPGLQEEPHRHLVGHLTCPRVVVDENGLEVSRSTGELEDVLTDADIVLTVTGRDAAIRKQHFALMKDGVVLCNAGQNSSEIEIDSLRELAATENTLRPNVEELTLGSGKKIFLLAKGNLINLAGGDGNPIEVMDLGLALQTLSLECIALGTKTLRNEPQTVPYEIEQATVKATLKEWVK